MRFEITKYSQHSGNIINITWKEFDNPNIATNWCAMNSTEEYAYMHEQKKPRREVKVDGETTA